MLACNEIYRGDCSKLIWDIDCNSIDCLVTDPPYGLSFMGKDWDKAVPSVKIWQECLRVLKPGAFAFVMCIPRQDCLARMMCKLEDAGFNVSFSSIYHTFATGFPKAQNLSKALNKRAGVSHATKVLDGAYSGFQPKPAVEVIIVAMKPVEEKTYIDQALENGHGCTWLDDCRIPFEGKDSSESVTRKPSKLKKNAISYVRQDEPMFGGTGHKKGRFPANILCEDDVLSDGIERKSGQTLTHHKRRGGSNLGKTFKIRDRTGEYANFGGDSGSFSRYFSLDAWFAERIKELPEEAQKTFPWLIVPKVSKSEKNRGLKEHSEIHSEHYKGNFHPTVKPIKLMSWLITLASREGEIVLDPFCGSGTTAIAAKILSRRYIGMEQKEEYCDIARKRLAVIPNRLSVFVE